MCSDSNHRFTCLPSTSASGEVVCCVIIFQRKTGEVPLDWRMGIDASVNPIRNGKGEITVSHNVGTGKFHPGGPKCNYFDAIELFPRRQCGPIPVIIVNGHQSQLNPSFIKYINNDAYRWVVCFGVPYATTIWQVGDAESQMENSKLNGTVRNQTYSYGNSPMASVGQSSHTTSCN
mmetsp:Transcript_22687/g.49112  ORF Transcript_22687/g.49112 Transcript_22687/m.49112 type:complete len:176 (+) Transcript_22687:734-1261(+)